MCRRQNKTFRPQPPVRLFYGCYKCHTLRVVCSSWVICVICVGRTYYDNSSETDILPTFWALGIRESGGRGPVTTLSSCTDPTPPPRPTQHHTYSLRVVPCSWGHIFPSPLLPARAPSRSAILYPRGHVTSAAHVGTTACIQPLIILILLPLGVACEGGRLQRL